jgi:hypothetical protein
VKKLVSNIKDENKTREERLQSVKELNAIAGTNITNLTDEKRLAKELANAYKSAVDEIKAKYIMQLAEGEVLGLIQQELELKEQLEKLQQKENTALKERNEVRKENRSISEADNKALAGATQMIDAEGHAIDANINIKKRRENRDRQNSRHEEFYQEQKQKRIEKEKEINNLQTQQNNILEKANKTIEGLIKTSTKRDDDDKERLTRYEQLRKAVEDENKELQRLIERRERGKATDKQVQDQIEKLRQAKIKLNDVDKQVIKINKELNDELKDSVDPNKAKVEAVQKTINAEQKMLDGMIKLRDNGAMLSKELIEQSIKVAKAKLKMAMLTISADDNATQAQVDNINKLKSELQGFESQLQQMGAANPKSGWLNKSLFGTGGEDGDGAFTGADFLNSITETMGGVMGVLDEVSNLQHQRLDSELGVIETEKNAEIEAYKKTAEFKVMSTKEQDAALEAIAKKHDDKMLDLKIKQFERDQQMQVAQALMAGSMAIMQIWSSSATGNAIADAIIKGILTAAQVAMTGLQLATIKAQKPPTAEIGGIVDESFASGGMVHGKSHANGGEKFSVGGRVVELEGGEAVINKKSTAMFRPMLSRMNEAGGGRKFADGGMVFATDLMETQANSFESMLTNQEPQEVLLVEAAVTDSQRSVANIEAKASF